MKTSLNTIIIAVAILFTAMIFSNAFRNRNKSSNSISVTGLGSKCFVSELIVWRGSFIRKNLVLKEAYAGLDKDREKINTYLLSIGIKADNVVFSAIDINKEFDELYDDVGRRTKSIFTGYRLSQNVQIESGEENKVEGISRQASELINSGFVGRII